MHGGLNLRTDLGVHAFRLDGGVHYGAFDAVRDAVAVAVGVGGLDDAGVGVVGVAPETVHRRANGLFGDPALAEARWVLVELDQNLVRRRLEQIGNARPEGLELHGSARDATGDGGVHFFGARPSSSQGHGEGGGGGAFGAAGGRG